MKHFRICRQKNRHHQENNSPRTGEHFHRNQYPPQVTLTDVNDQALIIVQQPAYNIENKHLVNGNYHASTYV